MPGAMLTDRGVHVIHQACGNCSIYRCSQRLAQAFDLEQPKQAINSLKLRWRKLRYLFANCVAFGGIWRGWHGGNVCAGGLISKRIFAIRGGWRTNGIEPPADFSKNLSDSKAVW